MKLAVAAALLGAAIPTAAFAAAPWAEIAKADIDRMKVLLEENHPGPVDPENPAYSQRMQGNYQSALKRAAVAQSFFDYKRAVLSYTNAFRDGHTGLIWMVDALSYQWPGFTAVPAENGAFRVAEPDPDLPIKVGDEIISCDGMSIDRLMLQRTDPFYWNADIPHEHDTQVGKLFAIEGGDEAAKLKSCKINSKGTVRDILLTYRSIPTERADRVRVKHVYEGTPSLRNAGNTWFIKLPSFMFQTPPQVAQIRQLLTQLKAHASKIRRGKVVLDVRGNAGGSSGWAGEIASAIWGEPIVKHVENSFDCTHDWRASPTNLKKIEDTLARFERDNMKDEAAEYRSIRDEVAKALRDGRPLARFALPPAAHGPPPKSPFTGRAYSVDRRRLRQRLSQLRRRGAADAECNPDRLADLRRYGVHRQQPRDAAEWAGDVRIFDEGLSKGGAGK